LTVRAAGPGDGPSGPAGPREGFVPAVGARLHYRLEGAGAPTLVFLHPRGLDLRLWEPQAAALAGTNRIVRVDQRGHGRSDPPARAYEPHADVTTVLGALELTDVVVVGIADGAAAALGAVPEAGGRIRTLVLVDPELPGWLPPWSEAEFHSKLGRALTQFEGADGLWTAWQQARVSGDTAPLVEALVHSAAVPSPEGPFGPLIRTMVSDNVRVLMEPDLRASQPASDARLLARLRSFNGHVLVISSDADGPRLVANTIERTFTQVRAVTFDAASPLLNLEDPGRFNAELVKAARGA
jgi:pimeloyl-ACP methyl ester carboxylesterase